jgi:16S rRNA (uracil1498-N3)-methyltransferase
MNLVLLEKKDFIGSDRVVLTGRRFEHLKRVNRVAVNDTLICGLLNDDVGTGTVTRLDENLIEMKLCLDQSPPESLPLTLVLALPRPKMLKRIIESATSLGVKKIYLINSWRVEKSFWQSPLLEEENLKKYMVLGLEQSRDTVLPQIHQKRFFTKFVTDELPDISKDSLCITAHPGTLNACPCAVNERATLVVGPEGGFIDKEIATLEKIGFGTYHIRQRTHKVETAFTYLISLIYT